jgi:hypothetical protein
MTTLEWLADHGIDAEPIGEVFSYDIVWNAETGRYQFIIYGPEHVGPKVLGVPIYEDGEFVDLLLIGEDMSFETACNSQPSCRVAGSRLHRRVPYRTVRPRGAEGLTSRHDYRVQRHSHSVAGLGLRL